MNNKIGVLKYDFMGHDDIGSTISIDGVCFIYNTETIKKLHEIKINEQELYVSFYNTDDLQGRVNFSLEEKLISDNEKKLLKDIFPNDKSGNFDVSDIIELIEFEIENNQNTEIITLYPQK